MKNALAAFVLIALATPADAAIQAKSEICGWLVQQNDSLVEQPDTSLQPSDSKPLAPPPTGAKAAYCARDTLMTYVGDERVLKLGLPLVIRSGGNEGVLEATPTVLFNYHLVNGKYVPGHENSN